MHALFFVSRPRFWVYLFGPYLIGSTAALLHGGAFSWVGLLFAVYFLYPANLLLYGVNDVFDADTDALNEKKQTYEIRFRARYHRSLGFLLLFFHLLFLPLLFFAPVPSLLFFFLFLFLGFFYSAPPFRFKVRPFFDAISNVLYVMPGLFAYAVFGGTSYVFPLIGAACLWAMAMHAYSAVPDIDADARAGISTVATVLGARRTLMWCFIFYVVSGLLAAHFFFLFGIGGALVYGGLMLLSLRAKNHAELFALYRMFPFVNTLMGALLFFALFL